MVGAGGIARSGANSAISLIDQVVRAQRFAFAVSPIAAGLLMPSAQFRTAFEAWTGDMDKIAALFGVSTQAATIRAKTLGLA